MANIDDFITDSFENDSFNIKRYFSNGININKYKKLINRKPKYVKKSGNYKIINYDFEKPLHYADIEKMLLNMNNLDIVLLEKLYTTSDNRNIYGIEIGKGKKVLYIDANIHAGESGNTVMIMKFLCDLLNRYYNNDQQIINKLNNVKLAIIPSINPDGYEIYNFGKQVINNKNLWLYKNYEKVNIEHLKCNARGIDVNRNFPTQNAGLYFKGKKLNNSVALSKTPKDLRFFCGKNLGIEKETQACMYFMLKHYKNVYAYLDMHSQGRVIYNGKPNLTNEFNNLSRKFAEYLSSFNEYEIYGLSYEEVGEGNDGTITDFMSELAHNFKLSTKTNRLSTDCYIENSAKLIYNYPVVTIETLTKYTRDVSDLKKEYYDKRIRDIFYDMLDCNFL